MTNSLASGEELHFQSSVCDSCGGLFTKSELDGDHWCSNCRPQMRRRLAVWRHVVAILVVLPFAIWVVRLEKLDFLPQVAWLLPLSAAYYLGFRIGKEVVKGYTRWNHSR